MTLVAALQPWRWQPHPEVWFVLISLVALGWYAARVIGPKVVPEGEPIITRRQRGFFVAGLVTLWLAADWPLHDIAEQYLYALHMIQHFVLAYIVPPLFLLAAPTWLARLIIGDGRLWRWLKVLALPVVAAVIEAPEPEAAARFGEAMWVKVFTTELEDAIDLEELVGGNPKV